MPEFLDGNQSTAFALVLAPHVLVWASLRGPNNELTIRRKHSSISSPSQKESSANDAAGRPILNRKWHHALAMKPCGQDVHQHDERRSLG